MTLDEAVDLARRFHGGAVDEGGRADIEHPLRVMGRVSGLEAKLAAVLHDLVEDSTLSSADLVAAGCPARVLQALDALTRRPDENDDEFVARAAGDPVARVVKLAELDDELDPDRLGMLDPAEASRLRTEYERARAILERSVPTEPSASPYAAGEPVTDGGPFARFDCGACGHPAGRVEYAPTAAPGEVWGDAPGLVVTSMLGRFVLRVEPGQVERLVDAVEAGDGAALFRLSSEFVPFWCRRCERAYCKRHWVTEMVMDEGFYDCTYGTCPAGHLTILDD